ncbi:MAG: Multidrug resistance efflux pump [Planctomycetaceae bacterium]|nr:Multidrug resistance efflux pump [Planctomycetaceae bacterium]
MIGRPLLLDRSHVLLALSVAGLLIGCAPTDTGRVQGYVEGEFVYIASPLAGKLMTLAVQRGDQVHADQLLFSLESTSETALRDTAERRVQQSRDTLEDLNKGKRPSEIASIEAQLAQAKAALQFSEPEYDRMEKLLKSKATSKQEYEQARATRDQDRQRVTQLEAELNTAKLGARPDQIAAARDDIRALEASLAKAEWDASQKEQTALQAGLVFDTLFREGEWVAAGRPVVILLPPRNIKARAFVPQTEIAALHHGDAVRVTVDGVAQPFNGKISYISPRAEFTPPVIYSQESRNKLVFMIEIVFAPDVAAKLHPGQPVDVSWKPLGK